MENMENEIIFIKLDDIIPNRFQPREVFDEVALNELADSIRQHGVIQPIVVRQVGNKYEIIAGERRYKASAIAGLTKIPAIIKNLDDKESSIVAYVENAQRRNVSAIEEARTSERILKTNNMTQEQLARELGISQSALANKLRLLSLPLEVQEALMKNEISERHARSLLSVKEPEKQIELLNKVKTNKMTVRELESEIKNMFGNNTTEGNSDGGMFINNNMNAQFVPTNMNNDSFLNNTNSQFMDNTNNFNNQFINNDFNNMNNFNSSNPTFNQPISTFENNMSSNNNVVENNSFNSNMTSQQPIVDNTPVFEDNSFLNFDSDFDPSKYEKGYVENNESQTPVVNNVTTPINNGNNGSFLDFLNDYDNNYPNAANDIMNSMDNNMPVNNEVNNMDTPVVDNSVNNANDDDFMNFLNNYDSLPNNNVSVNVDNNVNNNVVDNSVNDVNNNDFMNFLNNYDNNSVTTQPVVNNVVEEPSVNYQPTPSFNNPVINDVNPPVTSNFNMSEPTPVKYVEDDARYNDLSKPELLSSVDEIIGELQVVVDRIKNNSKFKIDTDEINFDDIYQITIKIDKRDIF